MGNKQRILLFNLAVDEDDSLLGFAVPLIARIARDAESVHVITVRAGRYALPPNVTVRSVGREAGAGKMASVAAFYRHLFTALRYGRFDICFSHMNQLFVVLAGPVLALKRIPVFLWYAHGRKGFAYRIAYFFSRRVFTSCGVATGKIAVTGHMADTDLFRPDWNIRKDDPPLFVSVGRVSPIKDLMTFVRAAAIMRDGGFRFKCLCVGPILPHDNGYAAALHAEVARLSLADIVSFSGAVPRADLPALYCRAAAHVNLCPRGALDKAVLEAAACGTPSVFANDEFAPVFADFSDTLRFRHGDPASLARALLRIGALPASAPARLRAIAVRQHSMDSFMRQFTALTA